MFDAEFLVNVMLNLFYWNFTLPFRILNTYSAELVLAILLRFIELIIQYGYTQSNDLTLSVSIVFPLFYLLNA